MATKRKFAEEDYEAIIQQEKPVKKYIHFCLGQTHGIIPLALLKNNINAFIEMNELVMTFCISTDDCIHPEDSATHGYVKFSRSISRNEIMWFLNQIGGSHIHNDVPCAAEIKNTDVDFRNILYLFEFFQSNSHLEDSNCLKEMLTQARAFKSSKSMLSAALITQDYKTKKLKDIPVEFLYDDNFDLQFRLEFAHYQGYGKSIYKPMPLNQSKVAELLGIELELLSILDFNSCVIAGGAAIKLGLQDSKFTDRCDVDFWVLEVEEEEQQKEGQQTKQSKIVQQICSVATKNGIRRAYVSSLGVITCIGQLGVRRIQITPVSEVCPNDVMLHFDLSACEAYYDGNFLFATASAQYSWMTKKCLFAKVAQAKRLVGMHWKGFELCDRAKNILFNTFYGWPICQKHLNIFEFSFLFLHSNTIPQFIQDASLSQTFGLEPWDEQKNECESINIKLLHGNYQESKVNIFAGDSIQNYVKDCCIIEKLEFNCEHEIQTDLVFLIPNCTIAITRLKLSITIPNIVLQRELQSTIVDFFVNQVTETKKVTELEPSFQFSVRRTTCDNIQYIQNGVKKQFHNSSTHNLRHADVLIKPSRVCNKEGVYKLEWNILRVSWNI